MTSQEFASRLFRGIKPPKQRPAPDTPARSKRKAKRPLTEDEAVGEFMRALRDEVRGPQRSSDDEIRLFTRQLKGLAPIPRKGGRTRTLSESCQCPDASPGDKGVIRNVLVLSANSKNGRRYERSAMQAALPMYEGVRVNCDHPVGNPSESRSVKDRLGKLVNVRLANDGIRADLRYNPFTTLGKQLSYWAKYLPDCIGLSHNAVGQGETRDGTFVVSEIVAVRSVDLVADPATTAGLLS